MTNSGIYYSENNNYCNNTITVLVYQINQTRCLEKNIFKRGN